MILLNLKETLSGKTSFFFSGFYTLAFSRAATVVILVSPVLLRELKFIQDLCIFSF